MYHHKELRQESVFCKRIKITDAMCKANGRMSVFAAADLMQGAAGEQLTERGLGFEVTRAQDVLWIVVWNAFYFKRLPKCGDTIELFTWPGKKKHWFYPRNCVLLSETGEELLSASYCWMLMDANTRKLTERPELAAVLPQVSIAGEPKAPAMKESFPQDFPMECRRTVLASDTDANMHFNNAHYLSWIEDLALTLSYPLTKLNYLWINYEKELLVNQEVSLRYQADPDCLFVIGCTGEDEHFRAKMIFTGNAS